MRGILATVNPFNRAYTGSLMRQIVTALSFMLLLNGFTIGYIIWSLEESQREHQITAKFGQFRLTVQMLQKGFTTFTKNNFGASPADEPSSGGNASMSIEEHITALDSIGKEIKGDAALDGHSNSRIELDYYEQRIVTPVLDRWQYFKQQWRRADTELGQQTDVDVAALYDDFNTNVARAERELHQLFTDRVTNKRLLLYWSVVANLLIGILLFGWFYRRVLIPMKLADQGVRRITSGDFGYQIPVIYDDEIGRMGSSFNHLSNRLRILFELVEALGQGDSIDNLCAAAWFGLKNALPLDWIGLMLPAPDGSGYVISSECGVSLMQGESTSCFRLDAPSSLRLSPVNGGRLQLVQPLHDKASPNCLINMLRKNGLKQVLLLQLSYETDTPSFLFFGSKSEQFDTDQLELLEIVSTLLEQGYQKSYAMDNLVIATVSGLAKLAESRDPETGDHLLRMSRYSAIIAEQLRQKSAYSDLIDINFVNDIFRFSPMHDIGKVGIEDSILLKPGKLDRDERNRMEQHPVIGGEVIRQCEAQINRIGHTVFSIAVDIVEAHHEKFDGSGYPSGIAGNNIPLSARIVAVADVFDALTTKRPYKEPWSFDDAVSWISGQSGSHFDPEVVRAFHLARENIEEVYNEST